MHELNLITEHVVRDQGLVRCRRVPSMRNDQHSRVCLNMYAFVRSIHQTIAEMKVHLLLGSLSIHHLIHMIILDHS